MPMNFSRKAADNPYAPLLGILSRNQSAEDNQNIVDQKLLQDQSQFDSTMTQRQAEQLANEKYRNATLAAAASARAQARKDAQSAILATTAGNTALINALGEKTNTINPMDAGKSLLANDTILTKIAQNENGGSTMQPFMQRNADGVVNTNTSTPPTSTGNGLLADLAMNTPVDTQKVERNIGEYFVDPNSKIDMNMGNQMLPSYNGQPRDAIFKAPTVEATTVQEPVAVNTNNGTPITSSLKAEQDYIANMTEKLLGKGVNDVNNQEAGLVSQQDATPETMIASLANAYKNATDPRAKNAIATQLIGLQTAQTKTAVENKKYTHELNKIKFKEEMGGKFNPKTASSVSMESNPESMQKFIKGLPGMSDDGLLGGITNKIVGNGKGRMTERKVNEYVALAKANKLSDAQIKTGLTTLSTNNWFFDNDVALSPEEFVDGLKEFVQGNVKTKY